MKQPSRMAGRPAGQTHAGAHPTLSWLCWVRVWLSWLRAADARHCHDAAAHLRSGTTTASLAGQAFHSASAGPQRWELQQPAPGSTHSIAWHKGCSHSRLASKHARHASTVLLTRLGVTPQLRGPVPMLADYELACPLAWLTVIPVSITVYGTVVLSAAYQQLM